MQHNFLWKYSKSSCENAKAWLFFVGPRVLIAILLCWTAIDQNNTICLSFLKISLFFMQIKVNRQQPRSVGLRAIQKIPNLIKWLIPPLPEVINQICRKHNLKNSYDRVVSFKLRIQAWFIHDTFMMHFRYKLWQSNIFSFIFLDRSFDFQWILLMDFLSICYISDAFMTHAWYIYSKLERKRL